MFDMLVSWDSLNKIRRRTTQCTRGAEWKRRKLAGEEVREVTAMAFSAYGHPLEMLTSYRMEVL